MCVIRSCFRFFPGLMLYWSQISRSSGTVNSLSAATLYDVDCVDAVDAVLEVEVSNVVNKEDVTEVGEVKVTLEDGR